MTVHFTDEELKWVSKERFNWGIKDECPERVRKELQRKLNMIYKKPQGGHGDADKRVMRSGKQG